MEVSLLLVCTVFVVHFPAVSPATCPNVCDCPQPVGVCCFTFEENSPPGSAVGTVIVNGTTGQYQWSQNNLLTTRELFSINSSGQITTVAALDRENGNYSTDLSRGMSLRDNKYCFRLSVDTSVGVRLVDIQITDVNDNPPEFSQDSYTITVDESMGNSWTPSCSSDRNLFNMLIAIDRDDNADTRVTYSVENRQFRVPDEYFPCIEGMGLDRDVPPSTYSVILVAQDSGNSTLKSTTNVSFQLTDINDNAPEFVNPPSSIAINETLMPGEVVYQFVASDRDAGNKGKDGIVYSLVGSNNFQIDRLNGTLTLTQSVDVENMQNNIELMVTATDNEGEIGNSKSSEPITVSVIVNDVNERGDINVFTMELVEGILYEDNVTGTIILTDDDRDDSNKRNEVFDLEYSSNSVTLNVTLSHAAMSDIYFFQLRVTGSLNREAEPFLTANVTLVEGGNPTFYTTEIFNITVRDINDNGPFLTTSNFAITEERPENINLFPHTDDVDNGINGSIAKYELKSANAPRGTISKENFTLTTNGTLFVPAIDREEVGSIITLLVNITDAGVPPKSNLSTVTLTVMDINDNPPIFSHISYMLNVTENDSLGTLIGRVHAVDPDEDAGSVMYIASSDDFSVDAFTGEVRTKREFDREDGRATVTLTITATDGADPENSKSMDFIVAILDDNDNNPVFVSGLEFSVPISLKVGKSVGEVKATDEDSSPENNVIIFKIRNSDFFAIPNNLSGDITLKSPLNSTGVYSFSVSAFNPGKEGNRSTIKIKVNVTQDSLLNMTLIIVIAATGTFFLVLIFIVILLLAFVVWKNKKSKHQLQLQSEAERLNNLQTSILKIPAAAPTTNGLAGVKSSRVTFKERVEETHYDEEISVINSTTSTIKKESVTKFDGSPQVHREDECVALSPASLSPISLSSSPSNGKPVQLNGAGGVTVVNLEMSPRPGINGDINGRCQYDMLSHSPPLLRMPPGNPGVTRGRTTAEVMEYSQGTSSDGGHTSVHDMDDESMYSDDASIVNTALSRYVSARPHMSSYDPASSHPHMELHRHLPSMSHGQHTNSSSLAQLHAYNLAQLAKSNDTENRSAQYSPMLSPDQDLTPTDNTIHHSNTISTESSIRTPSAAINHMGMSSANSKHLHMNGSRTYTHPPLVMPDAFPRDPPEVHRFPMGSFVDYGEASTYASTELDEALGFNEPIPGIISLTATDYDDDTQL